MPTKTQQKIRTDAIVTGYWMDHYVGAIACTICGNSGRIDSTGVRTPSGHLVGRKNWCICPNGQALRENANGQLPE